MANIVLKIEGMSCMHCVGRVDKALKALEGVQSVEVSLEKNEAVVVSENDIADEIFTSTLDDQGYDVVGIARV